MQCAPFDLTRCVCVHMGMCAMVHGVQCLLQGRHRHWKMTASDMIYNNIDNSGSIKMDAEGLRQTPTPQ